MTDFKRVLQNSGWNLLGGVLPLTAAVVAVPFLIARLGPDRFGVLSLVWVIVGYFSLLDLGIGRALTKLVAERQLRGRRSDVDSLCSTGVAAVVSFGILGAAVLLLAAVLLPEWPPGLPEDVREEVRYSVYLVALGMPVVLWSAALRGVLEGFQRFRRLNAIRVPAGVALFVAPCISAALTPRLDVAVGALLLARLLFLIVHVAACRDLCTIRIRLAHAHWMRSLVGFGGWLTVSNTVGPIIVYLDRFVIGAFLPPKMVAYYAAPFEVVSRLLIIPTSLSSALFPALSGNGEDKQLDRQRLQKHAMLVTLGAVVPMALIGTFGAEWILAIWLGPDFAESGAQSMQILLLGFVFNAASQLPLTALHSLSRTRDTALLHLTELPIYISVLIFLVHAFGLPGAAAAWTLRSIFDCAALFWLQNRAEGNSVLHVLRSKQ